MGIHQGVFEPTCMHDIMVDDIWHVIRHAHHVTMISHVHDSQHGEAVLVESGNEGGNDVRVLAPSTYHTSMSLPASTSRTASEVV